MKDQIWTGAIFLLSSLQFIMHALRGWNACLFRFSIFLGLLEHQGRGVETEAADSAINFSISTPFGAKPTNPPPAKLRASIRDGLLCNLVPARGPFATKEEEEGGSCTQETNSDKWSERTNCLKAEMHFRPERGISWSEESRTKKGGKKITLPREMNGLLLSHVIQFVIRRPLRVY